LSNFVETGPVQLLQRGRDPLSFPQNLSDDGLKGSASKQVCREVHLKVLIVTLKVLIMRGFIAILRSLPIQDVVLVLLRVVSAPLVEVVIHMGGNPRWE
jgi:hypothetical protein